MSKPVPSNKKLLEKFEDKSFIGNIVSEVLVAYKQPRVGSNKELAERFSEYFNYCAQNNVVPTIEEMCLYTGYAVSTVWDWESGRRKGFTDDCEGLNLTTAEIVKKAKEFMRVFDSKLVISKKMDPVTYIFRAKNYYGMKDKQEVEVKNTNQLGDNLSEDELAKKLVNATDIIDVEPSEDK